MLKPNIFYLFLFIICFFEYITLQYCAVDRSNSFEVLLCFFLMLSRKYCMRCHFIYKISLSGAVGGRCPMSMKFPGYFNIYSKLLDTYFFQVSILLSGHKRTDKDRSRMLSGQLIAVRFSVSVNYSFLPNQ